MPGAGVVPPARTAAPLRTFEREYRERGGRVIREYREPDGTVSREFRDEQNRTVREYRDPAGRTVREYVLVPSAGLAPGAGAPLTGSAPARSIRSRSAWPRARCTAPPGTPTPGRRAATAA
jgi:hypothetical protein